MASRIYAFSAITVPFLLIALSLLAAATSGLAPHLRSRGKVMKIRRVLTAQHICKLHFQCHGSLRVLRHEMFTKRRT